LSSRAVELLGKEVRAVKRTNVKGNMAGMKATKPTTTDIPATATLRGVKVKRYENGKIHFEVRGPGARFVMTSAYLDRKGGCDLTIMPATSG
jgi:hypothetical protein